MQDIPSVIKYMGLTVTLKKKVIMLKRNTHTMFYTE